MIYYHLGMYKEFEGVQGFCKENCMNSLKTKLPGKLTSIFLACVGGVLYALGSKLFIVPMGFYNGGMVGVSQLIRTALERIGGFNFGTLDIAGIIYYAINIPIFVLAFKDIGKEFFTKTLLVVSIITLCMTFIPTPVVPIVDDSLAACLIGGIISGAGTGLSLRYGASGGGADVLGVFVSKRYANMTVGRLALYINFVVYGIMLFVFEPSIAIYSVIYTVFMNLTVDKVHLQVINVEVEIFTKKDPEELKKRMFDKLYRGATTWQAEGGYTDEPGTMIYMIINKFELPLVKSIVLDYDEHAFMTYKEHVSVMGNFIKRL